MIVGRKNGFEIFHPSICIKWKFCQKEMNEKVEEEEEQKNKKKEEGYLHNVQLICSSL
jgi:phage pi2 protein 07